MRPYYTNLLFILSFSTLSFGQKYYSLNSGNWNNTTNVWSLNGITPCGCYPGNNLITDSIFVSHPINLTSNLSASSLSKIQINPSGSLSNSNFRLAISNSVVIANGSISVKEINVSTGGSLIISNSSILVNSRILLSGYLEANASNVTIIGGNIEVYASGTFVINGNSQIHFYSGNYKNAGNTSICDSCCLTFQKGNISNESTGIFTGSGNIISDIGNISNSGSWSPTLKYCTSGFDSGMPGPEDCIGANEICTVTPLPSEIVYFKGFREQETNILQWQTASELNVSFYEIEKSIDGENWYSIGIVNAAGNSTELLDYEFEDLDKEFGIRYYKLSQVDNDGKIGRTKTLCLSMQTKSDLSIYPNPTNENATVELNKNHEFTKLKVMDAFGRILNDINIDNSLIIEIQLPEQNGLYFFIAEGESEYSTHTVVKM